MSSKRHAADLILTPKSAKGAADWKNNFQSGFGRVAAFLTQTFTYKIVMLVSDLEMIFPCLSVATVVRGRVLELGRGHSFA
jgi:hypothetical protein